MKRGVIESLALLVVFLQGPMASVMEANQSIRPVSGPTDPLLPKPIPPTPTPTPPEPKPPTHLPRA